MPAICILPEFLLDIRSSVGPFAHSHSLSPSLSLSIPSITYSPVYKVALQPEVREKGLETRDDGGAGRLANLDALVVGSVIHGVGKRAAGVPSVSSGHFFRFATRFVDAIILITCKCVRAASPDKRVVTELKFTFILLYSILVYS